MYRRDFLDLISIGIIGSTIDIDKLFWIPGQKTIFVPSLRQVEFFAGANVDFRGISYYQSDESTRSWLGITRINKIKDI